jgi:F-type H+-transporting ATPase subunit epsilon
MPSNYPLEIITPERVFFSGEVESVIVPTPDGLLGIQRKHEPMVIALEIGQMKINVAGEWKRCTTSEGFIEIRPDKTLIFSQAVEWPEEIDLKRAQDAKDAAEERLRQKLSYQEYRQSQIALQRAMVRLQVGRKHIEND